MLTDAEIDDIARSVGITPEPRFGEVWTGNLQLRQFARAIIAKLGRSETDCICPPHEHRANCPRVGKR